MRGCAIGRDSAVGKANLRALNEMESRLESSSPSDPAACYEFSKQVTSVEAAIRHTYQIVASETRTMDDPAEAAHCWNAMVELCDKAMVLIEKAKAKFPDCGAHGLFDMALDYRNAASDRYKQNLQDSECKMPEALKDLFL